MANFLITGGAGFIGSALSKNLLNKKNKIWTIDNLSTGKIENISKKIKFIKANCQSKKIFKYFKKIKLDAIIHIAGQSSGEVSFENPIEDLKSNTSSVLNLLELSKQTQCKRFIYASSMSVYGNSIKQPVNEKDICAPLSFYGVGKFASENYIKLFNHYGINWTIFRLFNIYGPGQNFDNLKQGMISIYLAQLIKNDKIIVRGSKKRFRDFVYIDDLVKIFTNSIKNKNSFNEIINLGSGKKSTVNNVLNCIKKNYNKKIKIYIDQNTPGDQFGIYSDNKKLIKIFRINKFVNLELGIKKMIKSIQ